MEKHDEERKQAKINYLKNLKLISVSKPLHVRLEENFVENIEKPFYEEERNKFRQKYESHSQWTNLDLLS
jgi:hypothetical protein